MGDDFDIDSLSKTWQTQPVASKFNAKEIKRRYLIKKINLLAITLVELIIISAVIWLLILAFTQSWAIHLKIWLIFGLICSTLIIIPVLKSRLNSYRMISSSIHDWIELEKNMSEEALHRGKYSNYLILAFSIAIIVTFMYDCFFLEKSLHDIALRYVFGISWLLFMWAINRRQMKKHQVFLKIIK